MSATNKTTDKEKSKKADWKRMFYYNWIVRNVPYFLFVAVITTVYIANGHFANKTMRKISATEKKIKEMDYEFKTVKRQVIFMSKESELAKAVEPIGLKELTTPVIKINIAEQK
jgi:hypothetical protein